LEAGCNQVLLPSSASIAPISLRVNPDMWSHDSSVYLTGLKEKTSFCVSIIAQAPAVYRRAAQDAARNIQICGVDCHIGPQLTRRHAVIGRS